jgi:hypothetical protein
VSESPPYLSTKTEIQNEELIDSAKSTRTTETGPWTVRWASRLILFEDIFYEEHLKFAGAQLQSNVWLLLLRYTCIAWFHIFLIVLVPLWHPEGGETGILTGL